MSKTPGRPPLLAVLAVLAGAFVLAAPPTARAYNAALCERLIVCEIMSKKPLPRGFHDFRPLPPELRVELPSDGAVLCGSWKAAISFAKRLRMYSSEQAVAVLHQLWGGNTPCGFVSGLRLTPLEFARRGDDLGRKVLIVRYRDQFLRAHFAGVPLE